MRQNFHQIGHFLNVFGDIFSLKKNPIWFYFCAILKDSTFKAKTSGYFLGQLLEKCRLLLSQHLVTLVVGNFCKNIFSRLLWYGAISHRINNSPPSLTPQFDRISLIFDAKIHLSAVLGFAVSQIGQHLKKKWFFVIIPEIYNK